MIVVPGYTRQDFIRATASGERKSTTASPCLFDESDTHRLTPNVVMAGFIGTPSMHSTLFLPDS